MWSLLLNEILLGLFFFNERSGIDLFGILLKQYKFKLFIENVSLFNEGSVSFWFSQYILSKDIFLAKKERYQYEELINLLIDLVIYVLFVYLFSIRKCITLDVMMHE